VSHDRNGAGTGLDTSVPNVARVYDYLLGGKDNFAADRQLGEQLLTEFPQSAWISRQNRAFLGRAVRHCAEQGVAQFLDVGSGLPTMENVHQIARQVIPSATVVYTDNDPVAVSHAQALLADSDGVTAMQGDVREPGGILADAQSLGRIDLSRPVVVVLAAVLHFITEEEDPAGIARAFRDAMCAGSYLIVSHATHDVLPEESVRASSMYKRASAPMITRSHEEIAAFFSGLELVEPGLAFTVQWRAPVEFPRPGRAGIYAGVGRKP
jgi:hypothetical protein